MNHADRITSLRPLHELVAVVADLDAENMVRGILTRHQALGIRPIRNPKVQRMISTHDAGCYKDVHHLTRQFIDKGEYLIVLFDRHGSGAKDSAAQTIEQDVQGRLDAVGWRGRSAVVVFDPELEVWLWTDSPHTAKVMGWSNVGELRRWLQDPKIVARNDHVVPSGSPVWPSMSPKPADPKEAYLLALREKRQARSAAHFEDIARKANFKGCRDAAFNRFSAVLQRWFPLPLGID
jgi:hypothetical protein